MCLCAIDDVIDSPKNLTKNLIRRINLKTTTHIHFVHSNYFINKPTNCTIPLAHSFFFCGLYENSFEYVIATKYDGINYL